jgi:hypothetical protein
VDETLAAGTYRAYAVPLSLFVRYLRESLAHEPLLADLTVETARSWSQMLRERPKQVRGGQAEGNSQRSATALWGTRRICGAGRRRPTGSPRSP